MDCSMPGSSVLHYLSEFAQIHIQSWWCYLSIWPSASRFSFCCKSFPTLECFLMSQLFTSGGQSIGASPLASILPMNIQAWSCCPRDSQESSPTPQFKSINSLMLSLVYGPTLTSIHYYWKNYSLTRQTFVGKVICLLLNMLSRWVIGFLPRSKHLLISWLQSHSAVILEPPKIKSVTVSIFPHLFPMKWWDQMPWS